jgi:hypothetical protein
MLYLFFRIIKLRYSASWPISRKVATRWNVAVRFPNTADCSLRLRPEEGATPPASDRALSSFRHVLHHLYISTLSNRKFRIALPSQNSKFLSPVSTNCVTYPALTAALPSIHVSAPPPPPQPSVLHSDIYSYDVVDTTHKCKVCSRTGSPGKCLD